MQTQLVPIATLHPDPHNARRHSRRNLEAIKASLRRFGQQKPLVISADNIVLAGNGALAAAKELGWQQIAIVRSTLTGRPAQAYALADNRSAELADWDQDTLAQTLSELAAGDELDRLATGFSHEEINRLLAHDQAPAAAIPKLHQVLVPCRDEEQQQQVYELLKAHGHECRVLTL